MLVSRKEEGDWFPVTHHSGDVLWIRVCRVEGAAPGSPGWANLVFDDTERFFEIGRGRRRRDDATVVAGGTVGAGGLTGVTGRGARS